MAGTVWAVVPAGGRGTRFSADQDKLLALLDGVTVLTRTVQALQANTDVAGIVLTTHPDSRSAYQECLKSLISKKPVLFADGGSTRRESVYAGLQALPGDCASVLIHDAARPLVTQGILNTGIRRLKQGERALITALPLYDTIKQSIDGETITATVDRETLWRAQTPQFFERQTILSAHASVSSQMTATDDAQLVELSGICTVGIVLGEERNLKITRLDDLALASFWLAQP